MHNQPESARETPEGRPSSTDYAALHAEALELNHDTFLERAEHETDPKFAEDLRLGARIAQDLKEAGGLALVVGGYARDAAIARETGQPLASKDIDMEIYGLEFDDLATKLGAFGRVDLVGASFGIAKVTNPATGSIMDFSIPREDSKVDRGHKGFQVTGNPNMTVKEAAKRRDLTINSLAFNPLTGELVDEYGGLQDIKDGVLRATDAERFADDPLRVLRVMQFAGRFDFKVEPATAELCRSLDLTEISADRIGEEWIKLMTKSERPSVGLEVARDLGVLDQLHPELAVLDQIEQEPDWHPEGNVWSHSKNAADAAARVVREEGLTGDEALIVLFGALSHDLGKATTTQLREKHGAMRLTAYGHEAAGVEPAKNFLKELKMKHDVIDAILPIIREHLYHINRPDPTDKQLRQFAGRLQPANIRLWDLISRCDANGRGQAWEPHTASYAIYERSLSLEVSEKPAPRIVEGGDLIRHLGLAPGPDLGTIVNYLYDAQLGGEVRTVTEGIEYYHAHEDTIQTLIREAKDARERDWRQRHPKQAAKRDQQARDSQAGAVPFGEVIGLAIVLIAVCTLAVHQYYTHSLALKPPTHSVTATSLPSTGMPTPTPVSAHTLQVPELGLTITLPDGLSKSDVYYVASTASQTLQDANGRSYQQIGSVSFSTHSLTAKTSGCAATSNPSSGSSTTGLFTINKYANDVSSDTVTPALHNVKALSDGSYIAIADRQSSACSNTSSSLQDTQYQLFSQAYDSAASL